MDMNCGHCHNPSAWSKSERTGFDFRFETAIGNTQILDQKNRVIETLEDGEMPYLGVTVIDEDGLDLILQYINGL